MADDVDLARDGDEQPPEDHGNEAHTENFAEDGTPQPPEDHDNAAHTEDFITSDDVDTDDLADDPHGNEAHTENFAEDGTPQPPEDHGNEAHDRDYVDEDEAEAAAPISSVNGQTGFVSVNESEWREVNSDTDTDTNTSTNLDLEVQLAGNLSTKVVAFVESEKQTDTFGGVNMFANGELFSTSLPTSGLGPGERPQTVKFVMTLHNYGDSLSDADDAYAQVDGPVSESEHYQSIDAQGTFDTIRFTTGGSDDRTGAVAIKEYELVPLNTPSF